MLDDSESDLLVGGSVRQGHEGSSEQTTGCLELMFREGGSSIPVLRLDDPDHAALQHQRAGSPARRHQALRGEPAPQPSRTRSATPISASIPSNDGNVIRISVPQLTEERRRELVKQAKAKGEDAKVTVRNIRRKAMEELARIKKDGEAGEDEVGRAEKDLDKSTQTYTGQIDDLVKHKEGELLEV